MNLGHLLTAWTIRLALICYVAALGMMVTQRTGTKNWRTVRAVWTVGCVLFVAHVIAAFSAYHHWSHQAAFDDTAKQTKELMGWKFGYGIFVSYVFLVVWVLDVAWWWLAEKQYLKRPVWLGTLLHGFMLFIAFNGAVVFKGGAIRTAGILASVGLAALFWQRIKNLARADEVSEGTLEMNRASVGTLNESNPRYE